jgi:Asp-tRNA(Asn)/Glu-tRNA(Gln) amidotransferase B subunit
MGFLAGQVMKELKGAADIDVVKKVISEQLRNLQ